MVCFSNPLLSVFVTFSRLDHNELTSIPDLGQAASKIVSLYLWVLLHLLINMAPEDLYPKERPFPCSLCVRCPCVFTAATHTHAQTQKQWQQQRELNVRECGHTHVWKGTANIALLVILTDWWSQPCLCIPCLQRASVTVSLGQLLHWRAFK